MDILTLTNHLSREARTRITISLISGWITTIAVIYLYKSNENPLLTIIAAAAGWLFFQSLIPFDFPSHLGHSFLGTSKQLQHVFFIPPSKITTPAYLFMNSSSNILAFLNNSINSLLS